MLALLMPFGLVPISELSPLLIMVMGKPLANRVIPERDQPLCQAIGMTKLIEGQLILIAHDEIVFHIERGDAIAERGIEGIDFFPGVR